MPGSSISTGRRPVHPADHRFRAGVQHVHVEVASYPHFAGLTLDQAAICLSCFCQAPEFAGLVTEVNPGHDPDGALLPVLVDVLCAALAVR